MERRVDPIEARNDEKGRRLAVAIRRDPTLIAKARATLDRWLDLDAIRRPLAIERR